MTDNPNRKRTLGMTDPMWEAMAMVGRRNGRNAAEEIRIACDAWLKMTAGIDLGAAAFSGQPQSRRVTGRQQLAERRTA